MRTTFCEHASSGTMYARLNSSARYSPTGESRSIARSARPVSEACSPAVTTMRGRATACAKEAFDMVHLKLKLARPWTARDRTRVDETNVARGAQSEQRHNATLGAGHPGGAGSRGCGRVELQYG